MGMGMGAVAHIDGVWVVGERRWWRERQGVVVVVSDELAAVVTWLPALSSHMCQWYVEQCRTSHSQDCMV
jgi:hypothetical protein